MATKELSQIPPEVLAAMAAHTPESRARVATMLTTTLPSKAHKAERVWRRANTFAQVVLALSNGQVAPGTAEALARVQVVANEARQELSALGFQAPQL